ncbi:PREDICTED: putative fatty acyl-CoA reductase CG5065 isoform X1 [Vollenhovia emeryi]|uniref:putative fatty acyl-CoA reductase CG5065 isoform X1 n=2 Tax=Vollenhovia emeryi TaxID=411798 RepID=UPI0005F4FAA8|nr:PREDICTED: putative fatty acyl-CoA reductase CG5065 isoform X1 [Vollenhovia emeryi]XP_011873915.1 PREDICTED: putative fatty acyl-CoA reductase CG5065 isoform X1 [Vollenhovia emeryi]
MEEKVTKSEIQSFYIGKTVFITGASGFMGKVLLEKLLYCCSDLDKIYVLMRMKRGRSVESRLDDMFKLPLFQRLRNEKPNLFKKVIPLNGDICLPDLGLIDQQRELLINEVNVVFHFAATLRLESKLKDAIEMNTTGTQKVLDVAKEMKHLESFVHLSTAFCHVDQEELGERTYDSPDDPQDIMRLVQWLDEEGIDLITPKLLHPHPNTYTYSKRLAETLVANEYPNIPCCIARPSIVIPSYEEPMPGWVDNLNGPIGLMVGAGKGVIRSMHCNGNYHAEVIPVDFAINTLIAISYKLTTDKKKSKSIPVINVTQGNIKRITWAEVLEKGRERLHEYPFDGAIWYPDGDIRSSKFVHNLFIFFFHIIPAYLIDFLMLIFRQKRFMVNLQDRISNGLELLQYFTTREWKFYNDKFIRVYEELQGTDKQMFVNLRYDIDLDEYFKNIILGARQYCMKEDLSTLPKARRHQKIMYFVHIIAVYSFYFGILYYTYNNIGIVKVFLDYVADSVKSLPFIGGLLKKVHLYGILRSLRNILDMRRANEEKYIVFATMIYCGSYLNRL